MTQFEHYEALRRIEKNKEPNMSIEERGERYSECVYKYALAHIWNGKNDYIQGATEQKEIDDEKYDKLLDKYNKLKCLLKKE